MSPTTATFEILRSIFDNKRPHDETIDELLLELLYRDVIPRAMSTAIGIIRVKLD
jgi:hypothetical protein